MLHATNLIIQDKKAGMRIALLLIAGIMFTSVSIAGADPGVRQSGLPDGEPKRSYGAVDVIMYQTSW